MDLNHRTRRNRFTVCRVWPLRYPSKFNFLKNNNGAGNRTWTHNLLITSQLLYQLSYSGTWWAIQDSNLWPPACKAGALTNWANRPDIIIFVFLCHSLADMYNITMYYQRCQRFFKIFFNFFKKYYICLIFD